MARNLLLAVVAVLALTQVSGDDRDSVMLPFGIVKVLCDRG